MNEAIGWALFHFLWEGAAVALILAILLGICRTARARYTTACLALVTMLAAFAVTLAIHMPASSASGQAVHKPAGVLQPRPADSPTIAFSTADSAAYRWAVPLWMAGVVLLSLRRLAGLAGTYRLRHTGACLAPAPWPVRLREIASRLGVAQSVELLESCLTEVPVTAGYLRPAILLPVGMLAGLPSEQVEYILMHELAHIARRDYLVNVLQSVVEALLFYHPAVWWVSGVIRAEREHCCDDAVVALAGDARAYAAALVTLEQSRSMEPALAATGGSLTRRVRRLLHAPAPQSLAAPLAAAALALAIAGVVLAATEPQQIAPPQPALAHPPAPVLVAQSQSPAPAPAPTTLAAPQAEPQTASGLQGPYRKWLNEDVAYIITDAERQAFKDLPTDEEREQFIEQFWLRRDPTPGTPENEFKEEHYRRIAYTNEHFSADIAGWKTDRGRVYITYGPPDEIDDHSTGGTYQRPPAEGGATVTTVPFQQWRYRYIEGVGSNVIIEFVDPQRNGEYRMTADPTEKLAKARADALANAPNRLEQFAKLQKPPQAPDPATGNVYVANEPGGRVSVHVATAATPAPAGRRGPSATSAAQPGDVHSVTVSLSLPAPGKYSVQGVASLTNGSRVAAFVDVVPQNSTGPWLASAAWYHSVLHLGPGSYVLTVDYKNTDTGDAHHETVNFFVN